jgi:hypothetical protein
MDATTNEQATQRETGDAPTSVTISSGNGWTSRGRFPLNKRPAPTTSKTGVFSVQSDDTRAGSDPATDGGDEDLRLAMIAVRDDSDPQMREQLRRIFAGMRAGSTWREATQGLAAWKQLARELGDRVDMNTLAQVLIYRGMSAYQGTDPTLREMQAEVLGAGDVAKDPARVAQIERVAAQIFGTAT